jgi:hypothetical protein
LDSSRILRDNQIAARRERSAIRKRVFDAIGKKPTGKGRGVGSCLVEFDELSRLGLSVRVVVDFVDEDLRRQGNGDGAAKRKPSLPTDSCLLNKCTNFSAV